MMLIISLYSDLFCLHRKTVHGTYRHVISCLSWWNMYPRIKLTIDAKVQEVRCEPLAERMKRFQESFVRCELRDASRTFVGRFLRYDVNNFGSWCITSKL